jgi:hypothetical protein
MRPRSLSLALSFLLLAGGTTARAQSDPPRPESSQDSSQDSSQAPSQNSSGPQQAAPHAPTVAKPAPRPKRVFTNDDLQGKGSILFPTQGDIGIDIDQLNYCDRACFEQVRQAARIPAGASSQWKHDLLDGIEKIKADGQWQAMLVDLARMKDKYCQLGRDKNADLARHSDPRTVTGPELSIDDEYQRKFDALRDETAAVYGRSYVVAQKFSGITQQFANLQQQRVMNASCVQQPRYQPYDPSAEDPPLADAPNE